MSAPVSMRMSAPLRNHLADALLLLAVAFAARCAWFGDPVIQVDEQFYLLVGDRLLHGALPYVDVWDRKPIGLFLIYAAIRLVGGDGILQYQIVATLFAWATSLFVMAIARPTASRRAAWIAGALYILWLNLFTGEGGQSPVFYNLPVAAAAWFTLRTSIRPKTPARIVRSGLVVMALCGVAMQVKYTALFEGIFFGVALLWAMWRETRRIGPVLGAGAIWVAIAVLPSVAVLLFYVATGHGQAFLYANIFSVALRTNAPWSELLIRLRTIAALLSPLLIALVVAQFRRARIAPGPRRVILLWLAAAVGGFLLFGTYFDHYALPLLVPITAAAAPAFDLRSEDEQPIGLYLAGLIGLVGIGLGIHFLHWVHRKNGDAAYARNLVRTIDANLHGGCLFVYDGEPILYHLTHACALTPYLFPNHLNEAEEANAVGVDTVAETRRILALRPAVVVDGRFRYDIRKSKRPPRHNTNHATRLVLDQVLASHYRQVGSVILSKQERRIWARR